MSILVELLQQSNPVDAFLVRSDVPQVAKDRVEEIGRNAWVSTTTGGYRNESNAHLAHLWRLMRAQALIEAFLLDKQRNAK